MDVRQYGLTVITAASYSYDYPELFGPVVPEFRIVQPELMCAERDLYLHRVIAYVIERFVIVNTMRIAKFQYLELAHGIPSEKSNGTAFCLGWTYHPVEQVIVSIAFDNKVDVASLRNSSRLAGSICSLAETETAMQYIHFLTVDFQFRNERHRKAFNELPAPGSREYKL